MRVVSVFWGDKYSIDYVYRLKEACGSDFLCLSDVYLPGIETVRIDNTYTGWWNKLRLFDMEPGFLYLDLDMVVTDLSGIEDYCFGKPFVGIHDWWSGGLNSSAMWIGEKLNVSGDWSSFYGDQEYLQSILDVEYFPEGWFVSYKDSLLKNRPLGGKAVVFHGKPDPHEVLAFRLPGWEYVEDHWVLSEKDKYILFHHLLRRDFPDVLSENPPGWDLIPDFDGRVLDVGCGTGKYLLDHPSVIGVDIAPNACVPEVRDRVVCADACSLPFRDKEFDWVVCADVMEHIPNPGPVLREIARVSTRAYFQICMTPSFRGREINTDYHITLKPKEWWDDEIGIYFESLKSRVDGQWYIAKSLSGRRL